MTSPSSNSDDCLTLKIAGPGRRGIMDRLRHNLTALLTFVMLALAIPARAELVFFTSGRTMSVKGYRSDGDRVVLALRSGGEITCDLSIVDRIVPDEVAYPDMEEGHRTPDTPDEVAGGYLHEYDPIIERVSAEQGVDAKLVRALIQVESGYQRRARSLKGAMGLMQLMPETARQYALKDPYDPTSNITAGIQHLKSLLDRFPLRLALAAYNAGEAAVQRFRDIPPYPETRSYVRQILQLISR